MLNGQLVLQFGIAIAEFDEVVISINIFLFNFKCQTYETKIENVGRKQKLGRSGCICGKRNSEYIRSGTFIRTEKETKPVSQGNQEGGGWHWVEENYVLQINKIMFLLWNWSISPTIFCCFCQSIDVTIFKVTIDFLLTLMTKAPTPHRPFHAVFLHWCGWSHCHLPKPWHHYPTQMTWVHWLCTSISQ